MYMSADIHVQKKILDFSVLGSWTFVSFLMWVLRTKFRSSSKSANAFKLSHLSTLKRNLIHH